MKHVKNVLAALVLTMSVGVGTVDAAQRIDYYDANKTTIARIWNYDDHTGDLSGIVKEFNTKGQVEEETTYAQGMKNGLETRFYDDGTVHTKSMYKDDQLDGISYDYREDGSLFSKSEWKNGNISKNTLYGSETKTVVEFHGNTQQTTIWDMKTGTILSRTVETDTSDDEGGGMGVGGDILTDFPVPTAPKIGNLASLQGETTISFFLDKAGRVSYAYIDQSSGNIFLDEAALRTVESFQGTTKNGLPTDKPWDGLQGSAVYQFSPDGTVTLEYAVIWY